MTALAGLGRWATYRDRPSWFDLHPLPEDWRASAPTPTPPPVGEGWQWVVTDGRGRVLDGGTMASDLDDPQGVAHEALEAFLADRGMPAYGVLCAARLEADPGVVGVVDGRDW